MENGHCICPVLSEGSYPRFHFSYYQFANADIKAPISALTKMVKIFHALFGWCGFFKRFSEFESIDRGNIEKFCLIIFQNLYRFMNLENFRMFVKCLVKFVNNTKSLKLMNKMDSYDIVPCHTKLMINKLFLYVRSLYFLFIIFLQSI